LSKLLEALTRTHPLKLSVDEWKGEFGDVYPALQALSLLKPSQASKQALCPNCSDHYVDVIPQNDRFFAVCDKDASAGRMEINAFQLSQEKFDFDGFLAWLAGECGLEGDIAEAEDVFAWRLGSLGKSDTPTIFYCVRGADLEEINDFVGRVSDQKSVLFWFGEKPAVGYYPENIVSLADLISVSGRALTAQKVLLKPFLDEKFFAKSGDVELDKHIVLHRKGQQCYLLLNKKGNGFEKKIPIRPQTYKIINAVYGVRRKDPSGLTLFEFCHPRKIAQNDRTISTRINELNKLCEDHGITQILTKFPDDRWGLNRNLGCCKGG
jgi:hypothetical protein